MKKLLTWLGLAPINRHEAENLYSGFIGKDVIVFYEDVKGTSRKMIGIITRIDRNVIFMRSSVNGWSGVINCDICHIANISTREGWGAYREIETK